MTGPRFPVTGEMLKVLFVAGVLPGAAVVLLYLCEIRFYPSGASLGDGLIFIAISMVFVLLYSVYFAVVFSGAMFFLRLANWLNPALARVLRAMGVTPTHFPPLTWEKAFSYFGFPAVLVFGLLSWLGKTQSQSVLLTMTLLTGVYMGILNIPWRRRVQTRASDDGAGLRKMDLVAKVSRASLVGLLVLLPLWSPEGMWSPLSSLTHSTMQYLGIRDENVTVAFADMEASRAAGLGRESPRLEDVNVLWTGIGKRTLIEVPGDQRTRRVSLLSDDVVIIRGLAEQGNAVDAAKPRD